MQIYSGLSSLERLCGGDGDPLPVNGAAYVGHVLDLIEAMWFRADTVDWPEFPHRHLALAARSPGQAGVHDIVDSILAELNDGHSHFVRPSAGTAASPRQPPSLVGELRDGVGYIEVRGSSEVRSSAPRSSQAVSIAPSPISTGRGHMAGWSTFAGMPEVTCGQCWLAWGRYSEAG